MVVRVNRYATPYRDLIEKQATPVVIQTLHSVIIGEIYIRPSIRLIDDINNMDQFIPVTNAEIYERTGKVGYRSSFIAVNRDHVLYIIPKQDLATGLKPEVDLNTLGDITGDKSV